MPIINIPLGGKACLPGEILTVARHAKRGLLLEITSGKGRPYALLLRNNGDTLFAVHKCFAVEELTPCKHLRTAIHLAEKWLGKTLPRDVEVDIRWMEEKEGVAIQDLTPALLHRPGLFKTVVLVSV